MSELVFDGLLHTLTYYNKDGVQVGDGWYANNVVDRSVKHLRFLPNGTYPFLDSHYPHTHGSAVDKHHVLLDSADGSFGSFGIFRLMPFVYGGVHHSGVGVHSGRRNKAGADHATHGCIRTTDDVMEALVYYVMNDPLGTLTVINNHDQHDRHPHFDGDAHTSDVGHLA